MFIVDTAQREIRQTYPRGVAILLYGLGWLTAFLAGYLLTGGLWPTGTGLFAALGAATWTAALAGGLGGTTAMLVRLYRHLSLEQDFRDQPLAYYLIHPLGGLLAGILSLFLIAIPGALIVEFAASLEALISTISLSAIFGPIITFFGSLFTALIEILPAPSFVALQVLLGWIAGFYQRLGLGKLKSITRRGPTAEPDVVGSAESRRLTDILAEDEPFFYKTRTYQIRRLLKWTFSWGVFLLGYSLVWFVGSIALFWLAWPWLAQLGEGNHPAVYLIVAALPVAAAGSVGGVVSLLNDLQQHVTVKQDFHLQYLMFYLVQPIIGFMFGLAMYFLIATGYLALTSAVDEGSAPLIVDAPAMFMLQIVLGWAAGFRQQTVTDVIWQIVENIITLFKLIAAYFNPANLFDKEKRAERLAAIKAHLGLFDRATSSRQLPEEDEVEWWQLFSEPRKQN